MRDSIPASSPTMSPSSSWMNLLSLMSEYLLLIPCWSIHWQTELTPTRYHVFKKNKIKCCTASPPTNQICPAVANGSSGWRSRRWNNLHQLWWTAMITNNEDKKLHLTILMLVGAMSLTMVQLWKGWGSTSDSQYPVMPNNLQVGWRFRHWGWWWLKKYFPVCGDANSCPAWLPSRLLRGKS